MTNCFKCGQEIFFSDDMLSKSGKKMPCDKLNNRTLVPHDCPKAKEQKAGYIANKVLETTPAQNTTAEASKIAQANLQKYANMYSTIPNENNNSNNTDLETKYRQFQQDTNKNIKEIKETLGDMVNTLELIAIALKIPLPGREPTTLGDQQ